MLKIELLENATTANFKSVILTDISGKKMASYTMNKTLIISTKSLISGVYTVNIFENNKLLQFEKVVISR